MIHIPHKKRFVTAALVRRYLEREDEPDILGDTRLEDREGLAFELFDPQALPIQMLLFGEIA